MVKFVTLRDGIFFTQIFIKKPMKKTIKMLLSTVAAMLMVVSAYAQFTTSSMTGKVVDEKGEAMTGAAVMAVHTPSGSQYYAVVNAEGFYTIQGMRPGGPYEVEISLLGSKVQKFTDITLELGETTELSTVLKDDSELLDEVVVVADKTRFTTEKTGASVNVSRSDIENLPSASRSIADLTKLSPYANGMSFAGSDGRSTNFTVDGANFNNNFGLSSNLPGGGSPISVDALEEVQLVVAPYDVRQSNFVGGGINAITKSGTNTFKATAYGFYNNQDLRGNKIAGKDLGDRALDQNRTIGVTIGGPIVKDKLFFFANVEWVNQKEQTIKYHAALPGETGGEGLVSRTTAADMQRIADRLTKDYNYNPGSFTDFPGGTKNFKILARVDWNISDAHKLSVRFNKTDNNYWYAPNGNSCDDGYRNKSYNRVSTESMAFSNNMYGQQNNVWSVAAELNSRFADHIANQFIFTYTNINDMRMSNSDVFPHIDIMQKNEGSSSKPAASAGYELFTYNNGVKNSVFSAADNATFYLGAHKLTAGLSWERQNAQNSYMRNGTGYYRFGTIDDFVNGALPMSACLTIGANGVEAPVGQITYNKFSAYVQDEWNITKKFKLTYGVRADVMVYDNSQLMTNNAIKSLDLGGRSVDTGLWPVTTPQFSPRIGFNWDVLGDKTLKVRGGAGLFQGRLPLVFFTNMPQNAGMIQVSYNTTDAEQLKKLNTGGKVVTDVKEMAKILGVNTTITPETGAFQKTINGVDRNFKMPQVAKLSLAVDYKVPVNFPLTVTAEGMFSKTLYGVMLQDWNINESVVMGSKFNGVDSRYDYWALEEITLKNGAPDKYKNKKYIYPANAAGNQADAAYVLANTSKGYGWNAAVTIKTQPVKNLDITASYVHTVSKEISGMPGSNASSAYQGLYTVNGANFTDIQDSRYVVPDKVMANVSYFIPWKIFHGNGLHLNLYYSGYSPAGYSYITANDMNGDGNNADLMYIYPSGKDVPFVEHKYADGTTMTVAQQAAAYDAFLAQDKYMSAHKGKYAEAYSARSPFVHRFDFRIAEDFAFKIGNTKHNFQLSATIENIGNMINSEWGVQKWSCYQTSSDSFNITPLSFDYVSYKETGKPAFYMTSTDSKKCVMPTESFSKWYTDPSQCFRVLFGLKYYFN